MARNASPSVTLSEPEFDAAIDLILSTRVGGDYWGAQPKLPHSPYVLVRAGKSKAGPTSPPSFKANEPQLYWVDELSEAQPCNGLITHVAGRCDPWHLISGATAVFADANDELALVAAISGLPVHTPEGVEPNVLREKLCVQIANCSYWNPFTDREMSLFDAITLSAHWRGLIDANRPIRAAVGFAAWKKTTAAPLLWAGRGNVPFAVRSDGITRGDQVAAWKTRVAPSTLSDLEDQGADLIEVEDGFIRSIGLGADCVPPLSLIVDRKGIYFDPRQPSDLESIIEEGRFSVALLQRAQMLRERIVEVGLSKYDVGTIPVERRVEGRRHILVPGQVEDDRSLLCGGGAIRTNVELLRAVRRDCPNAYILYKPHPDVEAGHRVGALTQNDAAGYADEYVCAQPISSLIDMVDEVHVNTSLAGFEALMRGKSVTTHGVPFYAGWGLTRDLGTVPARRTQVRTIDELVAAALLTYPRYLDPITGLPCTAEILIERMSRGDGIPRSGPLVALRRLQGFMKRRFASIHAGRQ